MPIKSKKTAEEIVAEQINIEAPTDLTPVLETVEITVKGMNKPPKPKKPKKPTKKTAEKPKKKAPARKR